MARMLQCLLDELTFGNMGAGMPKYVRNDNSDAVYQVDSLNTATNEKRLNVLLERNGEEVSQNRRLSVGYIHGDINSPDGMAKSLSSANLRNLLAINIPRIATDAGMRKFEETSHQKNTISSILKLFRVELFGR